MNKPKSSPLSEYIRPAVDKKYKSRSEAAYDIGIDEVVLSKICSGLRPAISNEVIEKTCKKLGLDKTEGVLRLFLAKHSKIRKFFTESPKPISFKIIHPDLNDEKVTPAKLSKNYNPVPLVPLADISKTFSVAERAKEHILIPNDISPKGRDIKCCQIKGDDMTPTLPDGNIVAVDLDNRRPEHNGIYLLNWKSKIIIRRVYISGTYMILFSDNWKQPVEVCTLKKAKSDKNSPILGKIVWCMGEKENSKYGHNLGTPIKNAETDSAYIH